MNARIYVLFVENGSWKNIYETHSKGEIKKDNISKEKERINQKSE
jgi:hypothetical protein